MCLVIIGDRNVAEVAFHLFVSREGGELYPWRLILVGWLEPHPPAYDINDSFWIHQTHAISVAFSSCETLKPIG